MQNNGNQKSEDRRYKVSVVTPFHNVDMGMFSACADSMRAQTIGFGNIQWIIVVHNCDDGYLEQLTQMFSNDDNVIIKELRDNHFTPSSPRNHGTELVTAQYVGYLDADDSYLPDCLEVAVREAVDTRSQMVWFRREVEKENPSMVMPMATTTWNNTLNRIVIEHGKWEDDKMFEVFGIQSLTPEVPTAELTRDAVFEQTVILTRSTAMALYGTTDVAGRTVKAHYYGYNPDKMDYEWMVKDLPIRAVVEDVRYGVYDRDYTILFVCQGAPGINVPIIARLREGVDAQRFMEEHQHEVQHDLMTEHCYVSQMQTVREGSKAYTDRYGTSRMTHRNLLIAAFFAINLAFGVFGTLLMYTRQRREEAGVRRAFGATKWSVFWGFIREAWLLTTVSVIVGCIVYFQFAAAQGLFKGFEGSNPAVHYWFDDFGTHFLVVSVIVYLIILCAVLIATAIPAWRICRSEITVALKDE